MTLWIKQTFVVILVVTGGICAVQLGMRLEPDPVRGQTLAAWVQAVGSIGAILGAIWIAGVQQRRDEARLKKERESATFLLRAELCWLSGDVVSLLNQFIYIKAGHAPNIVVSDVTIAELLKRMSWCRQRVEHKGQLGMIGALRNSLTSTVRIFQVHERHPGLPYSADEIKDLDEFRAEAKRVYNVANGVESYAQYSA